MLWGIDKIIQEETNAPSGTQNAAPKSRCKTLHVAKTMLATSDGCDIVRGTSGGSLLGPAAQAAMKARAQVKGLPTSSAQHASRRVGAARKDSMQGEPRSQMPLHASGSAAHTPSSAAASLDATKDHYHRVLAEFSSPGPLRVRVNAKKSLVCPSLPSSSPSPSHLPVSCLMTMIRLSHAFSLAVTSQRWS